MEIKADKEGEKMIQVLCDSALKIGGLQNLNVVNTVLATLETIEGSKKIKKKDK